MDQELPILDKPLFPRKQSGDRQSVSSRSTTAQVVSIDDGRLSLQQQQPIEAPPAVTTNTVQTSATALRLSSFDPSLQANNAAGSIPVPIPRPSHAPSLVNVHNSSKPPSLYGRSFHRHPASKPSHSQFRYDDDNASMVSVSSLATSFSKNFLTGFLNNNKKDRIKSTAGLLSKEYWMKDETSAECFICSRPFTTFRRKHHCRICGQIFCSTCTNLIPGEKFGHRGRIRVCKTCTDIAKDYNDSSDEESILEDSFIDSQTIHEVPENPSTPDEQRRELSEKVGFTAPTPPPRMAIPATRNGESVEIPLTRSFNSRVSSIHTSKFRNKRDNNGSRGVRASTSHNESSFLDYINTHTTASTFNFNDTSATNLQTQTQPSPVSQNTLSDDEEDEGSMSIYAALHLDRSHGTLNSTHTPASRTNRANTRSLDRAQASLLRIKNRKKSRSISKSQPQSSFRLSDWNIQIQSSPNLSSPITLDDHAGVGLTDTGTATGTGVDLEQTEATIGSSGHKKYVSELNEVCSEHFKNLLHQSLEDEGVTDLAEWEEILVPLLQEVEKVEYNVKGGENMDIRQYVKLKRIFGGKKNDTRIVDGIVFSKTWSLKSMPLRLHNPRIALIMFPLEYVRSGGHYMSLEPVLAQEEEYIHKLVARIVALGPDVVFVGSSVSGLALKLLDEAGISVASNMKPQVIEKISRLTNADIVVSVDKLTGSLRLGVCKSLAVKTYAFGSVAKTVMIMTGCDERLGSTMVIRGGGPEMLRHVKEAVEFMVYVVCNLKLESAFYRDNFMYLSQDVYQAQRQQEHHSDGQDRFGDDFLKVFYKKILSSSPTVQFDPPVLLMKARDIEENLNKSISEYDRICKDIDIQELEISEDVLAELKLDTAKIPVTKSEYHAILKSLYERRIQLLEGALNIRMRQWNLITLSAPNVLDPQWHQRIAFLYSMVSIKNATPCIGPHPLQIDYYWDNDMTIGQYVEHLISSAHNVCSEGCGESISDHYRSYVHGGAKVDVIVERFQSRTPTLQNVILTWSSCKVCGYSTPFLPMSDTTYKYSFGKFLELCFWSAKNSSTNLGHCIHDFSKDHIKYFSLNDLTVRMEYSKVDILSLIIPRIQLAWKPHTSIKLKLENHQLVIEKSQRFFNSVLERLNRVKVDSFSSDQMEAGQKRIKELKEKVNEEQETITKMIEDIYTSTDASNHLAMNSVLRVVQDLSVEWDSEFVVFEKDFLPSEKDIARITTDHLKRVFMEDEKQNNDEAVIDDEKEVVAVKLREPDERKVDADDNINISKSETDLGKLEKSVGLNSDDGKTTKANIIDADTTPPTPGVEETCDNSSFRKVSSSSAFSDFKSSPRGKVLEEVNRYEKALKGSNGDLPSRSVSSDHILAYQDPSEVITASKSPGLGKSGSYSGEPTLANNLNSLKSSRSQFGISAKYLEQKLKEGRQRSFAGIPSPLVTPRPGGTREDSKVMKLTNFFDQIHFENLSKEFELQREKERRKLIQNRYKAAPVSSSKPIVEIYKDVKDAVNEDVIGNESDTQESINDERSKLSLKPSDTTTTKETDIPQTEKISLIKILSNFWADRSATLWKPLEYPLGSSDHIFVDSDVIVREDEPSSLVSFCLSSSDYVKRIDAIRDDKSNDLESIMLKKTAVHLKYQFNEGNTILSCKIFFAEQFDAFRRQCRIDDNFIQSLSRCVKWDSAGGKSGSAFLKTLDDRYVIKELSNAELDSFVKFAPSYFEYMAQALFHDLPTVIAKIFGFYQIHIKNPIDGRNFKMDILIMENLFYDHKNLRIFDLKGSMRNRHVVKTGKENEVLLDENMVEYIYESPLFVREYDKKLLKASLWNDTLFLAKMNVMDYSLVIGIDDENKLLTVGIIDCIRTFTWDKKLESWVKEKGFVGGGSKEPTVVTPRQYKNRFREAMDRYILMVPDQWFQGNGPL